MLQKKMSKRLYAAEPILGAGSRQNRTRGNILLKANAGKRTHVCNWSLVLIKHFDVRKSHLILHALRK